MQNVQMTMAEKPNLPKLDEELKASLPDLVHGVSGRGKAVTVHLDDQATDSDVQTARDVVAAHDPTQLTVDQQDAQQLEQERQDNFASPLDVSAYDTESATIQTLAQKVAWLEREIADLRGA